MPSDDPTPHHGWDPSRFTPEVAEEARRCGLDFRNLIDGSTFIQNLIAELEAIEGPTGGRTTDDGTGRPGGDDPAPAGGRP